MDRDNYLTVTQVLGPFTGMDKIPKDILAKASHRGDMVHKYCEAYLCGIEPSMIEDDFKGYYESFLRYQESNDLISKKLILEKRYYCDSLGLSGKMDLLVKNNDGYSLIDWKTSAKEQCSWLPQGCAYAYLCKKNDININHIMFIQLSKIGQEPKVFDYILFKNEGEMKFFTAYNAYIHFFKDKKVMDYEQI